MRILKLLNKNCLTFFCFFLILLNSNSLSNEPVDIWKIEPTQKNDENSSEIAVEKTQICLNLKILNNNAIL